MDYSHTTLAQHLINVLAMDQRHFNAVSKFLRRILPWGALRTCMRIYMVWREKGRSECTLSTLHMKIIKLPTI